MPEPIQFTPDDRGLLQRLTEAIQRQYGTRLQHIWLVGSRARGDARTGSDWDLLIFLDHCDYDVEVPLLAELAGTIERETGCNPLSLSPMTQEQFEGLDAKYPGIAENFRRDAVPLWDRTP